MRRGVFTCWLALGASAACAQSLDTIGVTLLRATTTNLDGSGVIVGQAEASGTNNDWEVWPGASEINLPVGDFTWYATNSPTTGYPNSAGVFSYHADTVGGDFYGLAGGVSTNVAHIENYEADYYYGTAVPLLTPFIAKVVNQSFIAEMSDQPVSDFNYDNYATFYNTLIVSAVGRGIQY